MCIICREWEKGKLTTQEALRAMGEELLMQKTDKELEHFDELLGRILLEPGESDASD